MLPSAISSSAMFIYISAEAVTLPAELKKRSKLSNTGLEFHSRHISKKGTHENSRKHMKSHLYSVGNLE